MVNRTKSKIAKKNANGASMPKKKKSVTVRMAGLALSTSRKTVPKQITQRGDSVTIHHRELLVPDVAATSGFAILDRFAINPAISSYSSGTPVGTWLPTIAKNYDKYVYKSLKLHYTTYAATTSPGMVIFSYDPNPDNPDPASLQDVQNMFYTNGSVHENFTFDVTPRLPNKQLYTRTTTTSTLPNYDAGFINMSCIGGNGTATGLVEVEYVIELTAPQSNGGSLASLPSIPVLPKQVLEATSFNGTTVTVYNPTTVTDSAGHYPQIMWNYGSTKYGADLITLGNATSPTQVIDGKYVYPNGAQTNPGTVSNCTFYGFNDAGSYPTYGTQRPWFTFNRAGRYKVEIEAPFDININATAAYQLFAFKRSTTNAAVTWQLPLFENIGLDGSTSVARVPRVHVQLGVESSAAKTWSDSTQRFEFEIATETDWYYCLFAGCEISSLVAGSCALTGRASVSPPPRMIVTYLGPRLTNTGLYDI